MKQNVRETIIKATINLLTELNEAESITVRQIAEKAGVGLGLINYHFQTRDALINEAIGEMMFQATQSYLSAPLDNRADPAETLKLIFKTTSEIGSRYSLGRFVVQYAMLQGNMETSSMIVPILRQFFGMEKTEIEIRLMALSMVSTLQIAYIRSDTFRTYSGMDIHDEQQRNKIIDFIVDQFLTRE
jgi:AcrR family transcriptional regulator